MNYILDSTICDPPAAAYAEVDQAGTGMGNSYDGTVSQAIKIGQ